MPDLDSMFRHLPRKAPQSRLTSILQSPPRPVVSMAPTAQDQLELVSLQSPMVEDHQPVIDPQQSVSPAPFGWQPIDQLNTDHSFRAQVQKLAVGLSIGLSVLGLAALASYLVVTQTNFFASVSLSRSVSTSLRGQDAQWHEASLANASLRDGTDSTHQVSLTADRSDGQQAVPSAGVDRISETKERVADFEAALTQRFSSDVANSPQLTVANSQVASEKAEPTVPALSVFPVQTVRPFQLPPTDTIRQDQNPHLATLRVGAPNLSAPSPVLPRPLVTTLTEIATPQPSTGSIITQRRNGNKVSLEQKLDSRLVSSRVELPSTEAAQTAQPLDTVVARRQKPKRTKAVHGPIADGGVLTAQLPAGPMRVRDDGVRSRTQLSPQQQMSDAAWQKRRSSLGAANRGSRRTVETPPTHVGLFGMQVPILKPAWADSIYDDLSKH